MVKRISDIFEVTPHDFDGRFVVAQGRGRKRKVERRVRKPKTPSEYVTDAVDQVEESFESLPVTTTGYASEDIVTEEIAPELIVYNEYFPEIYDSGVFSESDPKHIDYSINTLNYLASLGYNTFRFVLGGEYKESSCKKMENSVVGVCAYYNNFVFTYEELRTNAYNKAMGDMYYPPKIIIGLTHPGCRCFFECFPPNSPDEIPDSAPFLPSVIHTDLDIRPYKEALFQKLQVYYVDRFTILSPEIHKFAIFVNQRIKIAMYESLDQPVPIRINRHCLATIGLGLYRAVPIGYVGFLLGKDDSSGEVYLADLGYKVKIPLDAVEELSLQESTSKEADFKVFVESDHGVGVVLYCEDDGYWVYFPSLDEKKKVSEVEVLSYD